jgi:hypothetical protein
VIKLDQMKGFDYLSPDSFYDAINAYGLPSAIIELDHASQTQTRCFIRTAYGVTDPIIVSGINKQGGPASPLKSVSPPVWAPIIYRIFSAATTMPSSSPLAVWNGATLTSKMLTQNSWLGWSKQQMTPISSRDRFRRWLKIHWPWNTFSTHTDGSPNGQNPERMFWPDQKTIQTTLSYCQSQPNLTLTHYLSQNIGSNLLPTN